MRSHSFLIAIFTVVCKLLVAVEQPTITLKEGLPAKIPCMVKGVADAYFWRRGDHLNISDEIATIVFGVPGVVSDAFRVTKDGTLMIYNVTSAIEGRYFCRISTKDNEYYSDVIVLVQVHFDDFGFGIEQCYPKESCTLQVEASKETKLTCMAKGGPSSLSLKWFNGSKEINSVSNEHPLNEESSAISKTITVPNEFGLPLTCEAVASEDGQACARLVHVRLDKTDTAKEETGAAKRETYAQKKESFNTTTDLQKKLLDDKETLIEEANEKHEADKTDLTAKNTKLTEANIALNKDKTDLTAENTTLTDEKKALEKDKNDLTAEITKLTEANEKHEADKIDLTAKKTKLTEENKALKSFKKYMTAKNTTLTDEKKALEKEKNDLTAEITKLTKTHEVEIV